MRCSATKTSERIYAKLVGEAYAKKTSAKKQATYYGQWRAHQMSDHLAPWAELDAG